MFYCAVNVLYMCNNIVFSHSSQNMRIHFKGHLVKTRTEKVCGLDKPVFKLCWPFGQGSEVLLPHTTL